MDNFLRRGVFLTLLGAPVSRWTRKEAAALGQLYGLVLPHCFFAPARGGTFALLQCVLMSVLNTLNT